MSTPVPCCEAPRKEHNGGLDCTPQGSTSTQRPVIYAAGDLSPLCLLVGLLTPDFRRSKPDSHAFCKGFQCRACGPSPGGTYKESLPYSDELRSDLLLGPFCRSTTFRALPSATICHPAICGSEWVETAPGPGLPDGEWDWDVLQICAPAIGNVIPILRSLVKGRG